MNVYFKCDANEKITNFRVAESVINLCNNEDWELNAETVANMILLQIESDKARVLGCCGCGKSKHD